MVDSRIIFDTVIKISLFAGFYYIGDSDHSKICILSLNVLLTAAFISMSYQSVSSIYMLIHVREYNVQDVAMLVCFICICISSCSLIIFYTRKGPIIQNHYRKIMDYSKNICESMNDSVVEMRLFKYSKRVKIFLEYSMIVWLIILFSEVAIKALSYIKTQDLSLKGPILFYEVPYDLNSQTIYWQTLALQNFILFSMLMTQQTHRNYVFVMMILMTVYFQYL